MSSAQDYTLSVTYKGRSHRFTVPFDELKQYDRVLAQITNTLSVPTDSSLILHSARVGGHDIGPSRLGEASGWTQLVSDFFSMLLKDPELKPTLDFHVYFIQPAQKKKNHTAASQSPMQPTPRMARVVPSGRRPSPSAATAVAPPLPAGDLHLTRADLALGLQQTTDGIKGFLDGFLERYTSTLQEGLAGSLHRSETDGDEFASESEQQQQQQQHARVVHADWYDEKGIRQEVRCDGCSKAVAGLRFKCLTCDDFDLCADCVVLLPTTLAHEQSHSFQLLPHRALAPFLASTLPFSPDQQPILKTQDDEDKPRHNATCDVCSKRIVGDRLKCLECPDWDSCEACTGLLKEVHPVHSFVRIAKPEDLLRGPPQVTVVHAHMCDACHTSIRGVRFQCAHPSCPDFDLCEACEASPRETHPFWHPLLKIRTPMEIDVQAARDEESFEDKKPQQNLVLLDTSRMLCSKDAASSHDCESSFKTATPEDLVGLAEESDDDIPDLVPVADEKRPRVAVPAPAAPRTRLSPPEVVNQTRRSGKLFAPTSAASSCLHKLDDYLGSGKPHDRDQDDLLPNIVSLPVALDLDHELLPTLVRFPRAGPRPAPSTSRLSSEQWLFAQPFGMQAARGQSLAAAGGLGVGGGDGSTWTAAEKNMLVELVVSSPTTGALGRGAASHAPRGSDSDDDDDDDRMPALLAVKLPGSKPAAVVGVAQRVEHERDKDQLVDSDNETDVSDDFVVVSSCP